jgi:glycosyltransferase involved in cell wall biosynthesis
VLLSIIVTVRNEERNIGSLLDSLVVQEPPFEIIVVDAFSTDRTRQIVRDYSSKYENIRLVIRGGTRAKSRNHGVRDSKGAAVVFVDGDCIANPFWLHHFRERLEMGSNVVAGKTIQIGYRPFEDLERVELYYHGMDVTHPSSNLAYLRLTFEELNGFDEHFVTAEDIDLNLRAVQSGHRIDFEPRAVIYHRTRGSFYDFYRQAFWNGVGRKQLTLKHGSLWSSYNPLEMARRGHDFLSLSRLVVALLGYVGYKIFGRRL